MIRETTPRLQRVYLRFEDAGHGAMRLAASLTPPSYSEPMMVLLSRGIMPAGQPISLLLVSDPTQDPALRGPPGGDGDPGLSAYQLARQQGYGGTLTAWLASLVGAAGRSAYELARDAGYGGTYTQWAASLAGAPGKDGTNGKDATALIGSVILAETNLLNITAGVRRRVIATTFDLPIGAPLMLLPKVPPPAGYIAQAVWATKARELTVDLTTPAITALSSYAIDCWLIRLNI